MAVGLQPAGAMKLTVLLCCLVHGSADTPQILSVNTADTDNADRNFSTGDTITISFSALTPSGSLSFLRRIANTQTATNEGVFLPNKAAVDALLQFSVSLGAAYTAKWSSIASFLQQLVVTVVNPAGADYTALHAFAFNVSCVPGAIALESPTASDAPCTSAYVMQGPTTTVNWGLGRPHIQSVVSSSPNATLLLAAGDAIRVFFDAPVDVAAVATELAGLTAANGTAYVRLPSSSHTTLP